MGNPYRCKHFEIEELVPEAFLLAHGEEKCWMVFDLGLLQAADALREMFGPIYCNTWADRDWMPGGPPMHFRGYRPPSCTVGAALSQHCFGRALDLTLADVSAEEARQRLRAMSESGRLRHLDGIRHIRRVEKGVGWLHIDAGNHVSAGIHFFNP